MVESILRLVAATIILVPFLVVGACLAYPVVRLVAPVLSGWRRRFLVSTLGLIFVVALQVIALDGVNGLFFDLILPDGTEWAAGYSPVGFWRVRRGMNSDEVRKLVGDPLERYEVRHEPGVTGWRWTRNPTDTHYKVRAVLFRDGRVISKSSEFYVD